MSIFAPLIGLFRKVADLLLWSISLSETGLALPSQKPTMASVPSQTPPNALLSFVYVRSLADFVAVVMRGQVPGLASDRPAMYIQSHWPLLTVFACTAVVSGGALLQYLEFLLMKNPFPIGYFPEKMRLSNALFEKVPAARGVPGVTPPSSETVSDG
jgi:hypothetical protein